MTARSKHFQIALGKVLEKGVTGVWPKSSW
jgi:DNA-binding transcriptional regulator of glucitol operon